MRAIRVRKAVAFAAIGLGASLVIGGIAVAASTTATVVSDQGSYSGIIKPGPVRYHYTVTSTKCSIYSDHGEANIPCKVTGVVVVPPPPGNPSGTSTLTSADGTTKCSFSLTPIPNTASYKGTGPCTEYDKPDPGGPVPPSYPATVSGVVTPNPAAGTVFATFKVSELATQP
jgi:hypothetical protein